MSYFGCQSCFYSNTSAAAATWRDVMWCRLQSSARFGSVWFGLDRWQRYRCIYKIRHIRVYICFCQRQETGGKQFDVKAATIKSIMCVQLSSPPYTRRGMSLLIPEGKFICLSAHLPRYKGSFSVSPSCSGKTEEPLPWWRGGSEASPPPHHPVDPPGTRDSGRQVSLKKKASGCLICVLAKTLWWNWHKFS